MVENILPADSLVVERPISYSELSAAQFDLTYGEDREAALKNADAAHVRGLAGPGRHEVWMAEADCPLWTNTVQRLGELLDKIK